MTRCGYDLLCALVLTLFLGATARAQLGAAEAGMPRVVRHAELNPDEPVFVPVHPRIATTITFPKPIGEPVGTGFVDSELLQKAASEGKAVGARGEYAITYLQGDPFFTIQPLPKSELLNLNVPYEGSTIVLYFYLTEKPLDAVASLTFVERGSRPAGSTSRDKISAEGAKVSEGITKVETLPPPTTRTPTPARLEGFLRKLRLVHAARLGPELDDLAQAMNLKVAVSPAEDPTAQEITQPVSPADQFELILLRAVRDPALDAVGFVVLFRNTSKQEIFFDLRTLSARCGAALYTACVVDAPASLKPGELKAGYFVILGAGDGRPGYLLPGNDWRLSVALVGAQRSLKEHAVPEIKAVP